MGLRSDTSGQERSYLRDMLARTGGGVLEIGCGDGRLMAKTADLARYAVGVDLPDALVGEGEVARPYHLAFAAASGLRLPFRDGCFAQALFGLSL